MYLNFYQLHKKPFSLAPDPDFLYLSQQHKDALGAIIYGIKERQGFVSVVGEVGTGKTTIVRSYLQKSERSQVLPIFIFNSRISFTELMKTFLREVGISAEMIQRMQSLNDMVRVAYKVMLEKTRAGHTIVLIIDEAQNMPLETLAKLCVLSNFETAKAKLIQIVLVGQPELQKKLSRNELRQLRQRIAYRALITPLSQSDSADYMKHRLTLAAKGDKALFTQSAIKTIVKHSKGVPRVINILCENCLVAGYGLQKKPVSKAIVKQVVGEYEGKEPLPRRKFLNVAASLLFVLSSGLLLVSYSPKLGSSSFLATWQEALIQKPQESSEQQTGLHLAAAAASSEGVMIQVGKNPTELNTDKRAAASGDPQHTDLLDLRGPLHSWKSFTLIHTSEEHAEKQDSEFNGRWNAFPTPLPGQIEKLSTHLKVVKKGDTVSSLCLSNYGFVNSQVLEWIQRHNPHIYDLDEIQVNEVILFPAMDQANIPQHLKHSIKRANRPREEIVSR